MSEKDLLEIMIELDNEEKYFGIIPLYPLYNRLKARFNITLEQFHLTLLEMEKKNDTIYLEPINDISRLTKEEKRTAIYDQVRGYLYYVGRW